MYSNSNISCGVGQLHGFSRFKTPREFIYDAFIEIDSYSGEADGEADQDTPFFIFSDVITYRYNNEEQRRDKLLTGQRFATWLKRRNLGTVIASSPKINPNSGNKIRVWVWEVNKPALIKLLASMEAEE